MEQCRWRLQVCGQKRLTRLATTEHGALGRLHTDNLAGGLHGLQILPAPRDGATSAHSSYESVHLLAHPPLGLETPLSWHARVGHRKQDVQFVLATPRKKTAWPTSPQVSRQISGPVVSR